MIEPHLTTRDRSAIDIGCASGFFTSKLAERGMVALGIDVRPDRLEWAWRNQRALPGVAFTCLRITPETILHLPRVDVVLLLTVYHHWCDAFGRLEAEAMLRELGSRCRKLFFEPPGPTSPKFSLVGDSPIGPDESVSEYYSKQISRVFGGNVEVQYLGIAAYPTSKHREDPLYLIECEAFGSQ
jgi:SAM-dependent methyltransferase